MKNTGKSKYMSCGTKLHRHNMITVGVESSSDRSGTTEERGGVTTDMTALLQPDMAVFLRSVLSTSSYKILQFPDLKCLLSWAAEGNLVQYAASFP